MGDNVFEVALCFCAGLSTGRCFHPARMAKLVDAPGLGPDASNGVGVRVPPRAPLIEIDHLEDMRRQLVAAVVQLEYTP